MASKESTLCEKDCNELDEDIRCPEMRYFMNESTSDVTFIVEGMRIPAFKSLLEMKSKVFANMFSGNFKESNDKEVIINDTNFSAFKTMIQYIYCEQLVFEDKGDYLLAAEVFKLGHKYQLKRLMDCVEQEVIKMISTENVENIYKLAKFYKLKELMNSLNDFINENLNYFLFKTIDEIKRFNTATDNYLLQSILEDHVPNLKKELSDRYKELSDLRRENDRIKQFITNDTTYEESISIDGQKLTKSYNKRHKFRKHDFIVYKRCTNCLNN